MRHLSYFLTVAKELHFSRAADILGMAQAPLSQQIKQLEDRVGAKLFQRTTRSVKLTSAGEIFLQHALSITGDLEKAVAETRSKSEPENRKIIISGVQIAVMHLMPLIIAKFRQTYPTTNVEILPIGTGIQVQNLLEETVDICFMRPINPIAAIHTESILVEGLVAVLPIHHPLTKKDELEIKDFSGEKLITYAPTIGAGYHRAVSAAFRRAKIYPMVVQEASHSLSICALAGADIGIGIAPSWVQYSQSPHVTCRPIKELTSAVELILAHRADEMHPAVIEFIKTAREIAPTVSW